MRVLLVAPYALWTPHLETDLELAENHIEAGDEITWLGCDADLEICDLNQPHDLRVCAKCIGRRTQGLRALSKAVRYQRFASLLTTEDRALLVGLKTSFRSIEELRAYRFGAFDVGFAAHSSLVWLYRDSDVELERIAEEVAQFVRSSCAMYLAVKRYLRERPTDLVYAFNGRMAPMRAALRACQELGVPCTIHERGCDLEHYSLHANALPHQIAHTEQRIRAAWAAADPPRAEKERIATAWFDRRAQGLVTSWFSFTSGQHRERLPADWDASRRNVAIFTTSEYEFAAISDEWNNPIFADNTLGICSTIERCAGVDGIHVYLRMHPNLTGVDNRSTRMLRGLHRPGLTVLEPESTACSYTLMAACEKVIVTGSSVGIEAAFRGKPAILAGRCYYRNLGSTYVPASAEDLVALILQRDLPGKDIEGALMYGYYMATFGHRFRRFAPEGVFGGKYLGRKIKGRRLERMVLRGLLGARALSGRLQGSRAGYGVP